MDLDRLGLLAAAAGALILANVAAFAARPVPAYRAITRSAAATRIDLTGHDLTIEQLVAIARHGAQIRMSDAAKQSQADNYGLLLEAQAEGIPVYILNRGGGLGRANVILSGDPLSPSNKKLIEERELAAFERGALEGDGPEVADEALVRATMVIRANEMVFETPSAQLSAMLVDFLNKGITPVMQSRGTMGESDLYVLGNILGAMVGKGEVYLHGVRMPAAQALRQSGLQIRKPFGLDSSTFANSNGYSTALAALVVADGRRALDWADLADAIDLNGMNGSITPLSRPVQAKRPNPWLNWNAERILDMLKGSYLFAEDPDRMLADADSLRASSIRQGAAWLAWAALRDAVVAQMNSSDHNPVIDVGLVPGDSWELATPQMMQFFVKGGAYSNGKQGYVISSANWDPYPLVNQVEAFTNALANLGVAVTQRIYRFNNPFFTVSKATAGSPPQANGTLVMSLWQELQILAVPVPAEGVSTDSQGNGDLESQALLKAQRADAAVDVLLHLLAQDLLTGTSWMTIRKVENPARTFGAAAEKVAAELRHSLQPEKPLAVAAYDFITNHSVDTYYPPAAGEPLGEVRAPRAR